ncbi:MAG: glycine--tRNA ligase subunit beta [Nitrospirota bacterium]
MPDKKSMGRQRSASGRGSDNKERMKETPAADKLSGLNHDSSILLEIGTEEIPARFLAGAIANLKETAVKVFEENRLGYGDIHTFATPRRLALIIKGVERFQKDSIKEVFGPSKKAAFDDNGNPTKAATGFANSLGIDVSSLKIKNKGKGEYVVAVIEEKGVEAGAVLAEVLKKIILSLHFPKSMRWGNTRISFVRPIHWILAIFGSEIVNFELDGIKSSNLTRGHRFLSPAAFQIKDISSYKSLLENNFVLVDQEKRKSLTRKAIAGLFDNSENQPLLDEDLLDTVNFIVEFPVPVLCSFDKDYLKLPKELLITVMKDHQKYFAVQDINGNLANTFVVVSNTKQENAENVRTGAERVIKARFDDAKFYYHEDMNKKLSDRVESLKLVTFHDELGSLFDKTGRVIAIASSLSRKLMPSVLDKVTRAALLSKTDLITGVVREFPELQGIIGKYYAYHDNEDSDVADALDEQYLPRNFGDRVPSSDIGAILSLSDKIDNIASFFSIGLIPTGSEDPFALRRQAMGIVSILFEKGYTLTLREILETAIANLPAVKSSEDILEIIISFLEQRIEFVLSSRGYSPDIIKSVLSLSTVYPLRTVAARIEALTKFREENVFTEFLLAIKRVNNIVPKTIQPPVNAELFMQDEEKILYDVLIRIRDKIRPIIGEEKFFEGLKIFSEITSPINNFFDRVLVMDKEEEIKTNRLALLKEVWSDISVFADFSKILQD